MKKILLPTDFSENALNAISYALQLFKKEKCAFFLLNTYTPMIYNYEFHLKADQYMMDAVDVVKKNSEKKLDKLVRDIRKTHDSKIHSFTTISSFNTLTDEIVEVSNKFDIDLIVMGTKGASKTRGVLFGSNTIHVLKKAIRPVLAIPEDFNFEAPKEILFPTDYEVNIQQIEMEPLLEIAKIFNPRIHILHVFNEQELSETQEKNKQKLESYLTKTAHLFHNVNNQNIKEAIEKFQLRAKINLLVMYNNKHSFINQLFSKSVIHKIVLHLHIPLLIIPSKKSK